MTAETADMCIWQADEMYISVVSESSAAETKFGRQIKKEKKYVQKFFNGIGRKNTDC